MLKKARAEFSASKDDQVKNLSQTVRDSSRQIWLAGLGAFAKAQQEGTKLFDALVTRGEGLEARTRTVAAGAADAARGAAVAKAREMQVMAGETNELSAAIEALHKARDTKARPASAVGKRAPSARAPRTAVGRSSSGQQVSKRTRKAARKTTA